MTNRIVVMGGSFNPPTIAHLKVMQAAMDAVDACQGLFVPAPQPYVAKKMKKQRCPQDALGETVRLQMLESMCNRMDAWRSAAFKCCRMRLALTTICCKRFTMNGLTQKSISTLAVTSCIYCRNGIA